MSYEHKDYKYMQRLYQHINQQQQLNPQQHSSQNTNNYQTFRSPLAQYNQHQILSRNKQEDSGKIGEGGKVGEGVSSKISEMLEWKGSYAGVIDENLLSQIHHLQQIIAYLVSDKNMLKEQVMSLQMELQTTKTTSGKEKEGLESEIRKLKEVVKDKVCEYESVVKISKKQKEILQQQNERMKNQMKLMIERKNDELYEKLREKQVQSRQALQKLQQLNEGNKIKHKDQFSQLEETNSSLQRQLQNQKDKCRNLEQNLSKAYGDMQNRKQQMKSQFQKYKHEVRHQYHQSKLMLIQSNTQQLKITQQNEANQADILRLEISLLHQNITSLQEQLLRQRSVYASEMKQLRSQIQSKQLEIVQLSEKIKQIYNQKEKEIEVLKIKRSFISEQQKQSVRRQYELMMRTLYESCSKEREESMRTKSLLENQMAKNVNLLNEIKVMNQTHLQKISWLKIGNSQVIDALRKKLQIQKLQLSREGGAKLKGLQARVKELQFCEQEREKIEMMLVQKNRESQNNLNNLKVMKQAFTAESHSLKAQIKQVNERYLQEIDRLRKQIQIKEEQIAALNASFFSNKENLYEHQHLTEEIFKLKQTLTSKDSQIEQLLQNVESSRRKAEQLQQKIRSHQKESHEEMQIIKNEGKIASRESMKQMEEYFKQKLEIMQRENEQCQLINRVQSEEAANLMRRISELQCWCEGLKGGLVKRGVLQERVVQLGLNVNLIKNVKQMLQY